MLLGDARMFIRFASGLGGFLRNPLTPEQCRRIVLDQHRQRAETFLRLVERGVFAHRSSPYRRLFEHAGVEFGDVERLVRQEGVEGALGRLFDAGIHLKPDEFKGRTPIERPGLHLPVRSEDFDNPLLARAYAARTSNSRSLGLGQRIPIDLDLLTHDAAHNALCEELLGLLEHPRGQWRPVPPASAAMSVALRACKSGRPLERWFSQHRISWLPADLKFTLFTRYIVGASRRHGNPVPMPEHTPAEDVERVVRWLAEKVRLGTPALFDCPASAGVRVSNAAVDLGLDISGTAMRVGGEPFTPGKAGALEAAGCRPVVRYSLTELGNVAMPCANPGAPDAVHLLTDKVAAIERDLGPHDGDVGPPALLLTSLLPASPKIMINVDADDYAVVERRDCGCPMHALGFRTTLHTIRGRRKLTSEGMSFGGEELLRLIDTVLPGRFGGGPTDYQFVEQEENGLPHVSIVISPRVGPVDEGAVASAVLDSLGSRRPAWKMAAEVWRQGHTLRVVRREPYTTSAAKVMPLYAPPRT